MAPSERMERPQRWHGIRSHEQGESAARAPLWELASVYVGEQWRGRGVGSELVRPGCARG